MAMVRMIHPDIHYPGSGAEPASTTEEAFRTVWAPNGWVLADPVVITAADVLGEPVADLTDLKKEQLLQVAATIGAEGVGSGSTKAEITEAIQTKVGPEVEPTGGAGTTAEPPAEEV